MCGESVSASQDSNRQVSGVHPLFVGPLIGMNWFWYALAFFRE